MFLFPSLCQVIKFVYLQILDFRPMLLFSLKMPEAPVAHIWTLVYMYIHSQVLYTRTIQ